MNWLEHSSGGKKILLKVQNWGGNDHFIKCVYSYCYKVIHFKKMTFKNPCPVGRFTISFQVCRGLDCLVSPQPLPTPTNSATDTHCTEGAI